MTTTSASTATCYTYFYILFLHLFCTSYIGYIYPSFFIFIPIDTYICITSICYILLHLHLHWQLYICHPDSASGASTCSAFQQTLHLHLHWHKHGIVLCPGYLLKYKLSLAPMSLLKLTITSVYISSALPLLLLLLLLMSKLSWKLMVVSLTRNRGMAGNKTGRLRILRRPLPLFHVHDKNREIWMNSTKRGLFQDQHFPRL